MYVLTRQFWKITVDLMQEPEKIGFSAWGTSICVIPINAAHRRVRRLGEYHGNHTLFVKRNRQLRFLFTVTGTIRP